LGGTTQTRFMTRAEIAAARPDTAVPGVTPIALARTRMERTGQWHPQQSMGRRFAMGCVALEITQRCNLDCTLCYLSDHSEAVHDLPMAEVYRRIDLIRAHYGPHTDVQVTGGDPTLRKRDELVAIVRRIRDRGMRPALFTNGIKASRDLLAELSGAGLVDVAFHVDLTQGRKGYATEASLNAIRAEYIERARGLKLSVLFNTTVFDGNFDQIPDIVRFFVANADIVRLASFQLQADTGRGVARGCTAPITIATVSDRLRQGAAAPIALGMPVGHSGCNRYAMTLVANGHVHDLYDDDAVVADMLATTAGTQFDRQRPGRAVAALAGALLRRPGAIGRCVPWAARKLWAMRRDVLAARGRAHKLSFFIHDFMDAGCLDCDRIDACVFMVATGEGPISMCLHNAKRDAFILPPVATEAGWWDPLTGAITGARTAPGMVEHSAKTLKGRLRAARAPAAPELTP